MADTPIKQSYKLNYTGQEINTLLQTVQQGVVPSTRTINNIPLSHNITLLPQDIHALPDTTEIVLSVNGIRPGSNGNVEIAVGGGTGISSDSASAGILSITLQDVQPNPTTRSITFTADDNPLIEYISANMKVVEFALSNPNAQKDNWDIVTSNGQFTLYGSIQYSTDIYITFGADAAANFNENVVNDIVHTSLEETYPVGSFYLTTDSRIPFSFGNWEKVQIADPHGDEVRLQRLSNIELLREILDIEWLQDFEDLPSHDVGIWLPIYKYHYPGWEAVTENTFWTREEAQENNSTEKYSVLNALLNPNVCPLPFNDVYEMASFRTTALSWSETPYYYYHWIQTFSPYDPVKTMEKQSDGYMAYPDINRYTLWNTFNHSELCGLKPQSTGLGLFTMDKFSPGYNGLIAPFQGINGTNIQMEDRECNWEDIHTIYLRIPWLETEEGKEKLLDILRKRYNTDNIFDKNNINVFKRIADNE